MKTFKRNVLKQFPDSYAMQVEDGKWKVFSVVSDALVSTGTGACARSAWRDADERIRAAAERKEGA